MSHPLRSLLVRPVTWLKARWQALRRVPSLGERGERAAAKYLRRKGHVIIARSQRLRLGEIDLITADGNTLVLVEVKTRRSHHSGHPSEAVTSRKQKKLTHLAHLYRKRHGLSETPTRFDVVAITWPNDATRPVIEHYENAFEAIE